MAAALDVNTAARAGHPNRSGLVLAVAAFLAYESILIVGPWDQFSMVGVRHAAMSAAAAASTAACLWRSQFELGRARWAWRALSVAFAFNAISLLFNSYDAYVNREEHVGDDVGRRLVITLLPLGWLGLMMLADRPRVSLRVLVALDALIIAGSCMFVGWVMFLDQVYWTPPPAQGITRLFLLAGLAVDLALVLVVAVSWKGIQRTLALLGLGYASWVYLALAVYLFRVWDVAGPYDFGLFLGSLLIALAASGRPVEPLRVHPGPRGQWQLGVPYVCAVAVAGTIFFLATTGRALDGFQAGLGTLLGVLVLTRLFLTLLENRSITLGLEARVAERTEQLQRSQARFRSLLQNSSDVIAVIDDAGLVTYASPAVRVMLGYADDEVCGSQFLALVHPSDRDLADRSLTSVIAGGAPAGTVSCRLSRPDGTWCQVEAMLSSLLEDHGQSVVLNIRDVTERAALEEQLRHHALHDVLTSLGNRRLFNERVRHSLERAKRSGEDLAVLFIDLDNFKRLNDTAGHDAGDELLLVMADRLRACLRPVDTAARLGGDEFGVLLESSRLDEAEVVAQRVVESLAAPHRRDGRDIVLGASVGVAGCRGGSAGYEALLRDADIAMYHAKATGRGRYVVFNPEMHTELLRQVGLESGLREAIAQQRLEVHYQPIVHLLTGQISGVEALTRWSRTEEGAVPPSLFIPLAEESDMILSLDRLVLEAACTQVRRWQLRYPKHVGMTANVNFSALELRDSSYHDAVAEALICSGLGAHDLTLELTETAVMPEQAASLDQLTALRELGARISLDDFSTGHFSLATLRHLPLDEIKIDGSFVEAIGHSPRGRGIVRAIIELAEGLEVRTVAKGIESTEQLTALCHLRCVNGQGYLFAPPVPPERLEPALEHGLTALQVQPEMARPAAAPRFTY